MKKEEIDPIKIGITTTTISASATTMTNTRPVGFLPSYIPLSSTSLPPPSPSDETSQVKIIPPYPTVDSSNGKSSIPFPTISINPQSENRAGISGLISPKSSAEGVAPSAPSIGEIDNKTGLTPSERETIMTAFSKMRKNVLKKTVTELKIFFDAEEEVFSILVAAETRLTKDEKEEFVREVRKIYEIEKNYKASQCARNRTKVQTTVIKDHRKCSLIIAKPIELALIGIKLSLCTDDYTCWHSNEIYYISLLLVTAAYLTFYIFSFKVYLVGLGSDSLFCFFFFAGYIIMSSESINKFGRKAPMEIIMAAIYIVDCVHKFYELSKRIYSEDDSTSELPHTNQNSRLINKISITKTNFPSNYNSQRYYEMRHKDYHKASNNYIVENGPDVPAGVEYALMERGDHTCKLLTFLNVDPNDMGSDDCSNHNNIEIEHNYTSISDNSTEKNEDGDYGGCDSGGCDSGGGDYKGYNSGDCDGYNSGGGDFCGGDSGGGDCGGYDD